MQSLDFYLLGLESKLLQDERGIYSKYTYNNVLMTFVALEEWEKAKQFLEKYRLELADAERENVYEYNLSIFHFRRGIYDTALDLLRNVSFADPMYNLESRKMLLKIYFEQNAIGPLNPCWKTCSPGCAAIRKSVTAGKCVPQPGPIHRAIASDTHSG